MDQLNVRLAVVSHELREGERERERRLECQLQNIVIHVGHYQIFCLPYCHVPSQLHLNLVLNLATPWK